MKTKTQQKSGFTLVELIMASAVSSLVALGVFSMYVVNQNAWSITTLTINSSSSASSAMAKIVYGFGSGDSLRMASEGDVNVTEDPLGSGWWQLTYESGTRSITYDPATQTIVNQNNDPLADNVVASGVNLIPGGVELSLTVTETGGGRTATSSMNSFVRFRNDAV